MHLSKLNPFRNLPNPRQVWAWGMYDLANQSFTLLINTMLFANFFREVIVADPARGDRLWGAIVSGSLLLVVIASPFAGALADFKAWKKPMLMGLGAICVVFTCALGLLQPGWILLAAILYIPANFAFAIGENFLGAFLPEIAKPSQMGRISAIGWTMGYVGALVLLIITAAAMYFFELGDPADWRPLIVFAGLWFLMMAIPTALFLPERKRPEPLPPGRGLVSISVERLADTVRHARRFGHLLRFLAIFLVYSAGVVTVIFFAGIIAKEFGFDSARLALFMLQLTITAGIAAAATGAFQDRFGHKRTILLFLAVWTVTAIAMALIPTPDPADPHRYEWMFWLVGNGVGLGLGGIGTASRAMVGTFTPAHKTAEFFGLWGLSYKLGGVVGPVSFGAIKAGAGNTAAFITLAAVFAVSFVLMLFVNERAGRLAARQADRDENARLLREAHLAKAEAAASIAGGISPATPPSAPPPPPAPLDGAPPITPPPTTATDAAE